MNEQQERFKDEVNWLEMASNESIKAAFPLPNISICNFSGSIAEHVAIGIAEQRQVVISVLKNVAYLAPKDLSDALSKLTRVDILFIDRIDEISFANNSKELLSDILKASESVCIFCSVIDLALIPKELVSLFSKKLILEDYLTSTEELIVPIGIPSTGINQQPHFAVHTKFDWTINSKSIDLSNKAENSNVFNGMSRIHLAEIIGSSLFNDAVSPLTISLGLDANLQPAIADLNSLGHLLVASESKSLNSTSMRAEKNVFFDNCIISLLYKSLPTDCRMIIIDPSGIEFYAYEGSQNLLAPIVSDLGQAINTLNWCRAEIERRYKIMSTMGVRNLAGYNKRISEANASGNPLPHPFSLSPDNPEPLIEMPSIVLFINDMHEIIKYLVDTYKEESAFENELMTNDEANIKSIDVFNYFLNKGTNAGLHLVASLGFPLSNNHLEPICSNFPSRAVFLMPRNEDSQLLLDNNSASSLSGSGDMYLSLRGVMNPILIKSPLISDDEITRVLSYIKANNEPCYIEGILSSAEEENVRYASKYGNLEDDLLYRAAVAHVVKTRRASISSVQRHLGIGYNRAARLVETMESQGLVGPMQENGNREVLCGI